MTKACIKSLQKSKKIFFGALFGKSPNPSKSIGKHVKTKAKPVRSAKFGSWIFWPFISLMSKNCGTYIPFKRCVLMSRIRICIFCFLELMCFLYTHKIHIFMCTSTKSQYFLMNFFTNNKHIQWIVHTKNQNVKHNSYP